MLNKDENIEERIQQAIAAYQKNPKSKILPLSREFNVPYQRLRARINGRNPNTAKVPVNKRLNESQEDAIKRWIKLLDEKNCPPTAEHIQDFANSILRRDHTDPTISPPKVSKMWTYRFIERLPEYKRVKQKPKDANRNIMRRRENEAEKEQNKERWRQGIGPIKIGNNSLPPLTEEEMKRFRDGTHTENDVDNLFIID
ncbi:hypothetical protein, variant [Blastomyces dermatitidis ER-3]|uniref:HTH CENPB-type domain-containing protein n=2 Tax=Ajellomyces dermatitidis TaxID=5039 RepID=A0A0J9EJ39_AJEDA|nr:uncharacterized protein BDCG_03820 [Blastomyces dermatitidis ER-3]XP_045280631.1 hypothetical protein, variant [Blastomyces dermatitidis ER-3]KMW66408.1 hypothetical protein BDDG_11535 [Blastomyces dermatitidis ATCC 18188]OAT00903.1 hypothetical protein BDCG_03820 [Blastomyces dermatitidis ER-3]OAT00904.1 hypothetical protein, variant [Blastomyces dermatitidis ER-3]